LKFENIKFEYNDEVNSKIREFGITLIGKSSTFSLINSVISKENSLI